MVWADADFSILACFSRVLILFFLVGTDLSGSSQFGLRPISGIFAGSDFSCSFTLWLVLVSEF